MCVNILFFMLQSTLYYLLSSETHKDQNVISQLNTCRWTCLCACEHYQKRKLHSVVQALVSVHPAVHTDDVKAPRWC